MDIIAVDKPPMQGALASLRPWEVVVSWLVLAVALVGSFGIAYAAGTDWSVVWDLVRRGLLPVWAFVLPVIFLAGAVFLILRKKWSIPLFAAHLPLAVVYLASRQGIGSISVVWWLAYICEALMICFCLRLWARGALR